MNKIYSGQIEKVKSLVAGIQNNKAVLDAKGLNCDVSQLIELQNSLAESAKKQEEAESALKEIRDVAHADLDKLKNAWNNMKLPIKNNFQIEQWSTFGISDKR